MTLLFSDILKLHGIEPTDTHVARHHVANARSVRTPYRMWREDEEAFHLYQSIQEKHRFTRSFLASFVGGPRGHTLFVGFYKVCGRKAAPDGLRDPISGVSVGGMNLYDLEHDGRLSEFEGKLVIEWGPGYLAYVQNAENDKPVLELHREVAEPPFPGFLRLRLMFSEIPTLPSSWIERLQESKGVYLITCARTREHYVGSARGSEGFYARWCQHAAFQGDAAAFRSREPSDYQLSILELAGSGLSDPDILRAEQIWMQKLQSTEMGLNARTLSPRTD